MIVQPALERLKKVSQDGRAASRPETWHQWDALDAAIAVTERRAPALEALGEQGLRAAMRIWMGAASYEVKRAMIRNASMTELTEGNIRDAWELDQDTERRAEVRRELVDWLTDLGIVGVRLLLAVAFV